jgi:uncharacterized membrane protein
MMMLIVGLLLFLGIHLLPTSPGSRNVLLTRMGAGTYKIFFTIVSFIGLAAIVYGYYKVQHLNPGKNVQLWDPPVWMAHISLVLMWFAMIAIVAANVPSRIRNALKHPMLVAIKAWALSHLLANGDLASLLLFGSFLAYAVYDRISVGKRGALGPLGDKQPGSAINDVIVVGVGTALYAALLFGGHQWLFGVAPIASLSML